MLWLLNPSTRYIITDSKKNILASFYYEGNDLDVIPLIKRYVFNQMIYTLQIIAMDYREEDHEYVFGYAEVLEKQLTYIFHQETIHATSDLHDLSDVVRDRIRSLRETIEPLMNSTLVSIMKGNATEWQRASEMAREILDSLGFVQMDPDEFEEGENLSMDWI